MLFDVIPRLHYGIFDRVPEFHKTFANSRNLFRPSVEVNVFKHIFDPVVCRTPAAAAPAARSIKPVDNIEPHQLISDLFCRTRSAFEIRRYLCRSINRLVVSAIPAKGRKELRDCICRQRDPFHDFLNYGHKRDEQFSECRPKLILHFERHRGKAVECVCNTFPLAVQSCGIVPDVLQTFLECVHNVSDHGANHAVLHNTHDAGPKLAKSNRAFLRAFSSSLGSFPNIFRCRRKLLRFVPRRTELLFNHLQAFKQLVQPVGFNLYFKIVNYGSYDFSPLFLPSHAFFQASRVAISFSRSRRFLSAFSASVSRPRSTGDFIYAASFPLDPSAPLTTALTAE